MTSINDKLIQACKEGKLKTVKNLVSLKADISFGYNYAIRIASTHGRLDVVKYLISLGADISARDNNALSLASQYGHLDIVKCLVENKADVLSRKNEAIKNACLCGHLKVIKFLLSSGADYNKTDPHTKICLIQDKYYRRWRLIVFKNWFRKVFIPLYYSPGFPGYIKGKKELRQIIS